MDFLRYTHLYYLVFTALYALLFVKWKRIRELLPIAVLSIIILTIFDMFVTSLGLYQFNKPLINVYGAPIFHLLWAAPAGIIFIHYVKPGFNRKFVLVLLFTIITLALEFLAEKAGVASRLDGYKIQHSAAVDFCALVVLLWISEGLYGNRIYPKQ